MNSNELKEFTLVMDIDGTICPIKEKDESYEALVPFENVVTKLKEYKAQGAKIVLFTARNMNSYGGSIGMINVHTAKVMLAWLEKWEIPHDEIIYGKPWPGHKGFYVDDRSIRPDEFLKHSLEELENICKNSRGGL